MATGRLTTTFLLIACVGWVECRGEDATDEKFVPLFDGKTLDGWVQRGGKAKYTVEDGEIVGRSVPLTPNSFLCTDKDYGDFILELDFKVDPSLNSGIQIRSNAYDEPRTFEMPDRKKRAIPPKRVHGYQCEIDNDTNRNRLWTGGIYDEARRGWLYPGICGGDEKAFTEQGKKIIKIDDWNHVRIEAKGDHFKVYLNGELRSDFEDSMTPSGFIALQVHGVGGEIKPKEVRWKDIKICPLD